MLMSVMEIVWDLVVFLALVAVGLVVLNLMARPRRDDPSPVGDERTAVAHQQD
jgi:hypothetical protein